VNKSLDTLQHWSDSGVNKLIACFGTNDISNMPYEKTTPPQTAKTITEAVTKLNTFCTSNNIQLVYIMPGILSTVTTQLQTEVFHIIQASLPLDIIRIHTPQEMSQLSGSAEQDTVVDHCTSDGIHWQFTTGRHILKSALSIFGIGCVFPKINTVTSHYLVLKKHTPNVCFRCGSKSHSKPQCKRETSVKCSHCGSHSHNAMVCAYQFLPCNHCRHVGHYTGTRSRCPLWKRRHLSRHSPETRHDSEETDENMLTA